MLANMKLYYRIIVKDKNGKVIKKTRLRRSRSFTIAMLQFIEQLICRDYDSTIDAPYVIIKNTVGVNKTLHPSMSNSVCAVFCPDNSSTWGILVGTGTTAPTNMDYNLATQIAHGTGAGQLDYGAHSRVQAREVGSNVDLVISRSFYNGSGNTVTIKEIGFTCASMDDTANPFYFLLARDVVSDTPVLNTETATVQFTLRTTV